MSPSDRQSDPSAGERGLDRAMQRVALVVSLLACGLMLAGLFGYAGANGNNLALPGRPAVSLSDILSFHTLYSPLVLMSLGVVVLASLPALRVLLALGLYIRRHAWRNAAVALGVLLILLISARLG